MRVNKNKRSRQNQMEYYCLNEEGIIQWFKVNNKATSMPDPIPPDNLPPKFKLIHEIMISKSSNSSNFSPPSYSFQNQVPESDHPFIQAPPKLNQINQELRYEGVRSPPVSSNLDLNSPSASNLQNELSSPANGNSDIDEIDLSCDDIDQLLSQEDENFFQDHFLTEFDNYFSDGPMI